MRPPIDVDEQFISERIVPVRGAIETFRMARGEPGLPSRFTWRDREYAIAVVIESWKEVGQCTSGADERYVRKHWLRIKTTCGQEMRIYCDRQPRLGSDPKARWWLYTVRIQAPRAEPRATPDEPLDPGARGRGLDHSTR